MPAGPQQVYSRLRLPSLADTFVDGSGNAYVVSTYSSTKIGRIDHNRYFYNAFETIGPSGIARDNGFSAWVEVAHRGNVSVQIGFTRSIHYDINTATLMVNFNATSLIRTLTAWNRD